ncbi:CDP-diacylglycerol--glycerol-3-phosphate 3-phosphatidyltransferase [Polyangium sp. y55x31]|uniref:CDP-diacylglycerol--glycerol-3-phosphate 3-phosphatidyltransferase n=1 Tax=Polyangium sp. y55x31 TaxID=3042688 RepID=UPI0024825E44|nr:CDP-diacylglycerol--glycerol-3-phosphate 3-phosphatidyltransferase [Polyangium sp. y55x31]MDI1483116.1 CDP-diacylglycerol--glycerol-3-phosphate 3-phosphatidyltransferase [Polyangium sp. y55x31]
MVASGSKVDKASLRQIKAARRKTLWEDARNVPNLLTFARIVMIPIVLILLGRGSPHDCFWAAAVYALAAITDMLDGWLARRQGLVSVLGKFLDPLADKLIVTGTLVWLVPMGRISAWAVVLLISREITITALRSIASSEGIIIAAGEGGKTKTALQMIGIVCLILGYPYWFTIGIIDFGVVDLVHVGRLLIYTSLVFSLWSAGRYMSLFVDAIDAKNKAAYEGPEQAREK